MKQGNRWAPNAGSRHRDPGPPTNRIRGQWKPSDLVATIGSAVSKTNIQLLSSYNWESQARVSSFPVGTIIVPGSPAKWAPPSLPVTVPPDSGLVIISQNAYRHPKCPIEPLLQSLLTTQPTFDLNKIHLICDRNILRILFDFVCQRGRKDFDVAVEMVNNTALMTRLDTATSEWVDPRWARNGYGHAFENAFTELPQGLQGMAAHHRVIGYTFGRLNMVVRFEADAYDMGAASGGQQNPTETSGSSANASTLASESNPDVEALAAEGLAQAISKLSIDVDAQGASTFDSPLEADASGPPPSPPRLLIRKAGNLIPQGYLIELKTGSRSCRPQMWFSDTRHLYIGKHNSGKFTSVSKQTWDHVSMADWEKDHAEQLGQLESLLGEILQLAKGGQGRMRIRCGRGVLRLEEWDPSTTPELELEPLPQDLRQKWS